MASWWQSTLPNVQRGSLFARLQSIAATWNSPAVFMTLSAIGTVADAFYLQTICHAVDSLHPTHDTMFDSFGRAARHRAAHNRIQERATRRHARSVPSESQERMLAVAVAAALGLGSPSERLTELASLV